jgi:ubiquinone biosynthesis protein
MLVLESGELAIFDVGLVKRLGDGVLPEFMDFARCIVMGTPEDFVRHVRTFHAYTTGVDWVAFERDVGAFLARVRGKSDAELEMGAVVQDMMQIGRRYRVRPLHDSVLVLVGMVTAEGIGKKLNPESNFFERTAAYLDALGART